MHFEYQISEIRYRFDIFLEKGFTLFSNFDFVKGYRIGKVNIAFSSFSIANPKKI